MAISLPQSPPDDREFVKGVDETGAFIFDQVGFEQLDFNAIYGGKTTSSTTNTVGYGTKTWVLDSDDGKVLPGHTVQITALPEPTLCFVYGVVTKKDTTSEPAKITVAIHTASDVVGTFSDWEIQVVEVSREVVVEFGDADVTLLNHHKVAVLTVPLTAPRVLYLPLGDTLLAGARLLIYDSYLSGLTAGISGTNNLTIKTSDGVTTLAKLTLGQSYIDLVWDGASWQVLQEKGVFEAYAPSASVIQGWVYADGAVGGPYIDLFRKNGTSAANDNLGALRFWGDNAHQISTTYSQIATKILDTTDTTEDGTLRLMTRNGGTLSDILTCYKGIALSDVTGDDKGDGTINAKGYYLNGATFGAAATTGGSGFVELATSAETITGTDPDRAVTPAGLAALTGDTTRAGLVELATNAESITGTDNTRANTPAGLTAKLNDGFTSAGKLLSSSPTLGIGYAAGAGSTVTQLTSKSTGVTLNNITGRITTANVALAANTEVQFTFTNSTIAASDSMVVNQASGTVGAYIIQAGNLAAGSCTISIKNISAGSLTQAVQIKYTVIKAINA